jgi:methylated-DNA-[protein]-cysteine S-methyltransferase
VAEGLYYAIFRTPAGWVGVLGSEAGLRRLTLPHPSPTGIPHKLGISKGEATLSPQRFKDLVKRLRDYFSGHKVGFPDALDLAAATDFQRQVWAATRLIPYGQTRSYAWVAAQIGRPKAARAVGQALGRNPLPIIVPCHRVLASNGLGGFGGGLQMKKRLLQLEKTGI